MSSKKTKKEFENLISSIKELKLYNGTQITRWSSRNYIKPENDCEHQNIVTHITIYLCEAFDVDTFTYLCSVGLASIHDMFEYAEGGMGDIPHSVKAQNEQLKNIVENHEEMTIKEVPKIGKAWERFSSNEKSNLIVKFADQLDVILYLEREFSLGNRDEDLLKIYELAKKRVLDIYEEIKKEFYV